ncbi:hypothetical protein N864_11755 [Intrasporangium chromatireducens Q5-1]|uniref:Uncharacterized protein n=1 Tax=Intrasporangium chromatireducens Q5-1 TaxID=584657 RepID=W9GVY4_9MICO|nr:hypothetical protein [Intrasporangium chromatireducens]EWT07999.1 hypothetical protein N864_11755 [Intrasporangium chromatireducens Q5-1]
MSCTGSSSAPDEGIQRYDDDAGALSFEWPADGPEATDFLLDMNAWDEVSSLVNALARHAWFTTHYERERDGLPAPLTSPDLSPRAAELVSGLWLARIRPNPYLWTHAFVCLDCHWVGSFDVIEDLDLLLERDLHLCDRGSRGRPRPRG